MSARKHERFDIAYEEFETATRKDVTDKLIFRGVLTAVVAVNYPS